MNSAYVVRIEQPNEYEIPAITKEQIEQFKEDLTKYKREISICQWCFENPPVKDGIYCQECLDAANQEEDKQFDLVKWLEEVQND